ncbi:uncharacterized protein PSFLO_03832 [Pseudozyma flocculosa]|uniref:Uncharacterized protein n=1 Tax=Pseudozyma flocculosa TaxID=84751 RepID=A0A5C3F308_9BASI|nr:uncharacterized protein PSFLO_03832 [Pseudozyma flocculosa]
MMPQPEYLLLSVSSTDRPNRAEPSPVSRRHLVSALVAVAVPRGMNPCLLVSAPAPDPQIPILEPHGPTTHQPNSGTGWLAWPAHLPDAEAASPRLFDDVSPMALPLPGLLCLPASAADARRRPLAPPLFARWVVSSPLASVPSRLAVVSAQRLGVVADGQSSLLRGRSGVPRLAPLTVPTLAHTPAPPAQPPPR